jgi:hypothetical protein
MTSGKLQKEALKVPGMDLDFQIMGTVLKSSKIISLSRTNEPDGHSIELYVVLWGGGGGKVPLLQTNFICTKFQILIRLGPVPPRHSSFIIHLRQKVVARLIVLVAAVAAAISFQFDGNALEHLRRGRDSSTTSCSAAT